MTWINKLTKKLNLKPFEQDWGICNANPSRLDEFIEFYLTNNPLHPWEPEALAELIFQSAEEAWNEGMLKTYQIKNIQHFFTTHCNDFPITAEYWLELKKTEWYIPRILNKI